MNNNRKSSSSITDDEAAETISDTNATYDTDGSDSSDTDGSDTDDGATDSEVGSSRSFSPELIVYRPIRDEPPCEGCQYDAPGQMAHMGAYGCLESMQDIAYRERYSGSLSSSNEESDEQEERETFLCPPATNSSDETLTD